MYRAPLYLRPRGRGGRPFIYKALNSYEPCELIALKETNGSDTAQARNRARFEFGVEMKRCQGGEVGWGRAVRADCLHCLDEGMMSPQYYAGGGGERSAIDVGMYREAAATAVAQTLPKPRTRISSSSSRAISGFPPPLM